VLIHVRTLKPVMFADLDTLLTALYVELTDKIIPLRGLTRSGPGQRPEVSDAELVCIAVAQVLLRYDDERHWVRAAPKLIGQAHASECYRGHGRPFDVPALSDQLAAVAVTMG
jgi:hypothetical protein